MRNTKNIISQCLSLTAVGLFCASNASADLVTTTTFDGIGALSDAANWDNGLPSNANPGLVSATTHAWLGTAWEDVALRQTGGAVFAAGDGNFAMRGGAAASGNTTILEIDDASNTSFATTNLAISGTLTFWSQNSGGGGHELSLLNGYATVSNLNAVSSATLSTINIGNGKLDIATLTEAKVTVNMLSGGTGEMVIGDRNGGVLNSSRLNFETGNAGSITILSNAGASSGGYWEFYVRQGWTSINGVTVTDVSRYKIVSKGFKTTISALAVPEPPSAALIGIGGVTLILRDRR
jgi:hypothetical protein